MAWTGTDDDFKGFIDTHGLTFPQISDDPAEVFQRFGVPSQPALVVVDASGRAQQLFGAVEPELLDSILSNLGS